MNPARLNVLHILPHAGGGVGTVLRALLKQDASDPNTRLSHGVAVLETLNEPSRLCCQFYGIPWVECADTSQIRALVMAADIVLVHWWNHPLLMKLLFEGLPPSRLAFWSHVNGYGVPQAFFTELFAMPDRFIFATPASLEAPVVKRLGADMNGKLRVIPSCAGVPVGAGEPVPKTGPFQCGYIGTVEPAKMHPDFLTLCASAQLDTPCVVAGGPAYEALRAKAEALQLADAFEILGPISDPHPLFRRLHAFAYPLVPSHYGTGEQVLIEAMAFGAVPVVLANPPERALIQQGKTGLVVEHETDFAAALQFLASHPAERDRMAEAGRRFVLDKCPIQRSQTLFHQVFDELMDFSKNCHPLELPVIDGIQSGSPLHLYLSSCRGTTEYEAALAIALGQNWDVLLPPSFGFATRGAPAHYLRLLGADPDLERVVQLAFAG